MKTYHFIQTLLMLALLSACSQNSSKATLKVAKAFAVTGALSGGTIIYGENVTTGKNFSIPLALSGEKTITLENGTWRFAAVGWEGPTKFSGISFCGSTEVAISQSMIVDLNLNELHCTDTSFMTLYNQKELFTTSAGAFYQYNATLNTFSAINSDSFESTLPDELRSTLHAYKLISFDVLSNQEVFSSSCLDAHDLVRIKIPTKKFPFRIKFFPSMNDCLTLSPKHKVFEFRSGISAGNKAFFDQDYSESGAFARLVLPSSLTNRGRSPFMNQIPRILCTAGNNDCIPEPSTSGHHVNINWERETHHQLLIKDVGSASCANFVFSSYFFNYQNCQIDNGQLRSDISRNQLTCQDNAITNHKDIYYKGDKIYLLKDGGTNDYIEVLTTVGSKVSNYVLSENSYTSLAVDDNGAIYVGRTDFVRKLSVSGNGYNDEGTFGIPGEHIEISPDGNFLYASSGNFIKSYTYGTLTQNSSYDLSMPISQIQLVNSMLLISTNGINGALYESSPSFGSLTTPVSQITRDNIESFHHDGSTINVISSATGQINSYVYDLSFAQTASYTLDNAAYPVNGVVKVGAKMYLALTNKLEAINFQAQNTFSIISNLGTCTDTFSFPLNGGTQTLSLVSSQYNVLNPIFNDAFNFLGRRQILDSEHLRYYFESLGYDREIHNGGKLRRVQEMMGPTGISGLLSEFNTCTEIVSKAATSLNREFTKTMDLFDPIEGESMHITLKVKSPLTDLIPDYLCVDNNPLAAACASNYDLIITFTHASFDESETTQMKLSCARKVGSMESLEEEASELYQNLTLWNTNDMSNARFEDYTFSQRGTETWAEVTKLGRTSVDDFWVRNLNLNIRSSEAHANVNEFHLNGTNVMSSAFHINAVNESGLDLLSGESDYSGFSWEEIKNSNQFSVFLPNAQVCMSKTNNYVDTTNDPSCAHTSQDESTSDGIALNVNSLLGIASSTHPLRLIFNLAN